MSRTSRGLLAFTQNSNTSTSIQIQKREFCSYSVQVKFSTNVNPFLEDRLGLKRVKKRWLFEQSPLFFSCRASTQSSTCVSPPDREKETQIKQIIIKSYSVLCTITPLCTMPLYSCGSVVEHCVSSAKVVGSIPREHTYWQNMYNLSVLYIQIGLTWVFSVCLLIAVCGGSLLLLQEIVVDFL